MSRDEISEEIEDLIVENSVKIDDSAYEIGRRLDVFPIVTDTLSLSDVPPPPSLLPLGDLDGDGVVGTIDFFLLLAAWGQTHTSADLDGDGVVGTIDFFLLLANWG